MVKINLPSSTTPAPKPAQQLPTFRLTATLLPTGMLEMTAVQPMIAFKDMPFEDLFPDMEYDEALVAALAEAFGNRPGWYDPEVAPEGMLYEVTQEIAARALEIAVQTQNPTEIFVGYEYDHLFTVNALDIAVI